MKAKGRSVDESTKLKIERLVKENPHISCRELAEQVGIASFSNIHYHLRRLMKAGRIEWLGSSGTRGPLTAESVEQRWKRGDLKMPKLTKAEQDARIEMVVRKAQSSVRLRQDHDQIHDYRSRFNGYTLKAHKV